jgi:hypothetical protein
MARRDFAHIEDNGIIVIYNSTRKAAEYSMDNVIETEAIKDTAREFSVDEDVVYTALEICKFYDSRYWEHLKEERNASEPDVCFCWEDELDMEYDFVLGGTCPHCGKKYRYNGGIDYA